MEPLSMSRAWFTKLGVIIFIAASLTLSAAGLFFAYYSFKPQLRIVAAGPQSSPPSIDAQQQHRHETRATANPTRSPPLKVIRAMQFDRVYNIRENATDAEIGQRSSWQRRKLCEAYSIRPPPRDLLDKNWTMCKKATDLLAYEFESPRRIREPNTLLLQQQKHHHRLQPHALTQTEVDEQACRDRESQSAADMEASIAVENPKLLASIAEMRLEFARRRKARNVRQRSAKSEIVARAAAPNSSNSNRSHSRNLLVTFTLDKSPVDSENRNDRRLLLYSFAFHAVPGRDVMIFVCDYPSHWLEIAEAISIAVLHERNLTSQWRHSISSYSWRGLHNNGSSSSAHSHRYHGNHRDDIPSFSVPPFFELRSVSSLKSRVQQGIDPSPSNARIWYLESLVNELREEDHVQLASAATSPAFTYDGPVITCDSRDVVFFRNPFNALHRTTQHQLNLVAADEPWVIAVEESYAQLESYINRGWVSTIVGSTAEFESLVYGGAHKSVLSERSDLPRVAPGGRVLSVLCSGLYAAADLETMSLFAYSFRMTYSAALRKHGALDQGAFIVAFSILPSLIDITGLMRMFVLDARVNSFASHHFPYEHFYSWRREKRQQQQQQQPQEEQRAAVPEPHRINLDSLSEFIAPAYLNCVGEPIATLHQLDRFDSRWRELRSAARIRIGRALVARGLGSRQQAQLFDAARLREAEWNEDSGRTASSRRHKFAAAAAGSGARKGRGGAEDGDEISLKLARRRQWPPADLNLDLFLYI